MEACPSVLINVQRRAGIRRLMDRTFPDEDLAARIRAARAYTGRTRREFVAVVNRPEISERVLARFEDPNGTAPSASQLEAIASACKLPLGFFTEDLRRLGDRPLGARHTPNGHSVAPNDAQASRRKPRSIVPYWSVRLASNDGDNGLLSHDAGTATGRGVRYISLSGGTWEGAEPPTVTFELEARNAQEARVLAQHRLGELRRRAGVPCAKRR